MESFDFYDAGLLRQLATNLFYGWGYNFYRIENQLRADDLLVRTKAASLLGMAAESAKDAEAEYRRKFLPAPTRQNPLPDGKAVAMAQQLERLTRQLSGLEASIHHQPAPENDRVTERYRKEAATLATLVQHDEQLIGQCELLRTMLDGKQPETFLENLPRAESGVEAIRTTLRNREAVLSGSSGSA